MLVSFLFVLLGGIKLLLFIKNVKIQSKSITIAGITGTWEGYVAAATDLYYMGVRNYGLDYWCLNETAKWDTASVTLRFESSSQRIYTMTELNLTAYTGVKIKISNSVSSACGTVCVCKNTTSGSGNQGSIIGKTPEKTALNANNQANSPTTIIIPFTEVHALTARIGFYINLYSGSISSTLYQFSLY